MSENLENNNNQNENLNNFESNDNIQNQEIYEVVNQSEVHEIKQETKEIKAEDNFLHNLYQPVTPVSTSHNNYNDNNNIDNSNIVNILPEIKEEPKTNVYRWNITDDNNFTDNKKSSYSSSSYSSYSTPPVSRSKQKKAKSSTGLKVFAGVISVLFLFSAVMTTLLLTENTFGIFENGGTDETNGESVKNNESTENTSDKSPSFELSNKDAVNDTNKTVEDTSITTPENPSTKMLSTEEAIEKIMPSVVCITTETTVSNGRYYGYGYGNSPYTMSGVGTGFIVSEDGYIATNCHVIEGANKIVVTLSDERQFEATLVGSDATADLAIIKIDATNLPVAELGDSDSLKQGQDVVAIGTPAGVEFAGTATKGIVSAINRVLDVDSQKTMTVIQTDASINPGNSGGPLINMKGQVVGINSMKLASTQYEGMGFAIPINIAIPTFNHIIANPGTNVQAPADSSNDTSTVSFGLQGASILAEESEYYNIPQGWKISIIDENGPCYNSGLQPSDIIIALDGEDVMSTDDMYRLKLNYNPGDQVTITIYRNGDVYDFTVTLAARQAQ